MFGTCTTRIDTILANEMAFDITQGCKYDYKDINGLDHIPITASTDLEMADATIDVACKPCGLKLPCDTLPPRDRWKINDQDQRDILYKSTWSLYSERFTNALNDLDIDRGHELWCEAQELFLWRLSGQAGELPDAPRRGTTMPVKVIALVHALAERVRKHTRLGAIGREASKVLAQARELRAKLHRRGTRCINGKETSRYDLWWYGPHTDHDAHDAQINRDKIVEMGWRCLSKPVWTELNRQGECPNIDLIDTVIKDAQANITQNIRNKRKEHADRLQDKTGVKGGARETPTSSELSAPRLKLHATRFSSLVIRESPRTPTGFLKS